MGRVAVVLTIFALTTGFDQGSKEWARSSLEIHQPKPVIAGFWDWELAMNPGAAFSSFRGGGTGTQIILSILAMLALVGIGVMAARTAPEQRLLRVALAMIGGGALGNLIDRMRDGAVTDFVRWRWRWHEHAWPIFNVADAALLIADSLVGKRRRLAA